MNSQMAQAIWTPRCQPRRSAKLAFTQVTITCRVCSANVVVTLSNDVLLCQTCQTNTVVAQATLDRRTALAYQTFLAVLVAATEIDIERYGRVCSARQRLSDDRKDDAAYGESVARRLAEAQAAGDGLSVILAAAMQLQHELNAVARVQDEIARAVEVRICI